MKFTPVNSGLLAGAINLILFLVLYIIGPQAFGSTWTGILLVLYSLGILIWLGFQGRKENGGYFTWFEAFKFLLIVGVIFQLASTLTNFLFFNVLDPDFMIQVKDITIEKSVAMFEGFGMTEGQIDKAVTDIEESFEKRMSISGQLIGFGTGVLILAAVNCLLALVIKKNRPEFA